MNSRRPSKHRDERIGRELARMRRALGKSQEAVAEAVGVSAQQISKYESGRDAISASRLEEIIEYLRPAPGPGFSEQSQAAFFGFPIVASPDPELEQIARDLKANTERLLQFIARR